MSATFAERKLHTIELLAKLEDEELLLLIEQILTGTATKDWADDLSESEKTSIRKGLNQLNSGEGEDLNSFKKRMQSKHP